MPLLDDLFKLYKKSNAIKTKPPHQASNKKMPLEFGDVVEIYQDNNIMVATIIDQNQAILMSEFWEFATNTDMIVNLKHPLGDKWIIELDKRLFVGAKSDIYYYSSLPKEYKDVLKKVLDGEELPAQMSGPELPFNPRDPRWKFKKEELKKIL